MKNIGILLIILFCVAGKADGKNGSTAKVQASSSFEVQAVEIASYSEELALGCYCGAGGKLFVTPQWLGGDAYVRIDGKVSKLKFDKKYQQKMNHFSCGYSNSEIKVSLSCDQTTKVRPEPCGEAGCNEISEKCIMDVKFKDQEKKIYEVSGGCYC